MSCASRTAQAPRELWAHVLSDSEASIAEQIAAGLTNAVIARMFWITEQTVKFHVTNIIRKLEATNRTDVARWWALNVSRPPSNDVEALAGLIRSLWLHTPQRAWYQLSRAEQALLLATVKPTP